MTRLKSVAEQAPWELGVAELEAGRSAPPGPRATPSQAGRKQSEGRVGAESEPAASRWPSWVSTSSEALVLVRFTGPHDRRAASA